jgi:hypothetical protein
MTLPPPSSKIYLGRMWGHVIPESSRNFPQHNCIPAPWLPSFLSVCAGQVAYWDCCEDGVGSKGCFDLKTQVASCTQAGIRTLHHCLC